MEFNNILKDLRLEVGKTQKEVADGCGLTPTCICQLESGVRKPTGSTVKVLANYFGVSADYLLGRVDDFGVITSEEKAAGASLTKKVSVTPIEDELLHTFREIGKKKGENAQQAALQLLQNVLKI